MRLRFASALLFISVATLAFAATRPPLPPLTPKEKAQGYTDHAILAKPRTECLASVDAAEAATGVLVRDSFPRLENLRVIDVPEGASVDATIARLKATGRYEFVEPDYIMHQDTIPNDPYFTSQWSLNNVMQSAGYTIGADIKAPDAWDIIHDAPNVVIAIVDGGVRTDHQDIAPNLWHNPTPTFGDTYGASFLNGVRGTTLTDEEGHGTHVAGIICAAGNNRVAISGVVWKTQLMVLKNAGADGLSYASDSAACINYAIAHGANVINCSFGGSSYSSSLYTAIKAARDAGIVVVCAAGNDGTSNDVSPHYPSNYLLDNIISVGNSTGADSANSGSDYGNLVDLFAPGTSIISLDYSSTSGTVAMTGTSMAAPHVTGAIALLKARFPNDTYRQLINRLLNGTDLKIGLVGRAVTNGRLNLSAALNASNNPFNDSLTSHAYITGSNVTLRANNTGATIETTPQAEVVHAGGGTASLWWQWYAPATGTYTITTAGSAYDTGLDVYTSSNDSALTYSTLSSIASNDDDGALKTSRVTISATQGHWYYIAVSGVGGATGFTQLNIALKPANDDFANAAPLSGISTQATGINTSATLEPGEPQILGQNGSGSLWYKWTAPKSDKFQVSVFSYYFDALLGIYTGSSVSNLTLVTADDDTNLGQGIVNEDSRCTLNAVGGTTYYFQVESKTTERGTFTLTLTDSLWQASTYDGEITSAPAVGPDGTVYVGGNYPDHRLYALNPDGSLKWAYSGTGSIDNASPAIGSDGTVYQELDDGSLVALNSDGTVRWTKNFGNTNLLASASNSIAIASDGTLYTHADDGYLYAVNSADGSIKWRYDVGVTTYASASVAPDGTIYQGSDGTKTMYAFNPDGTLKWQYSAGGTIYSTPAIDGAGNIYFSTDSTSQIISLTPTGTLRWKNSDVAETGDFSASPVLSADGSTVYIGGGDSKLHAINATTGVGQWTYTCGGWIYACTPAVDSNGVVYVGAYDGKLYAINASGTLNRTWDTAEIIRSSPVISGTTLYVGSSDAKLYAFDIGAASAGGPWPAYRQNPRRLGRATSDAVAISVSPASHSIALGDSVLLDVTALGGDPLTFQWYKNGVAIAGATNDWLSIANAAANDAGDYTVVVKGPTGSVTSSKATISFAPTAWISNLSVRANMSAGQTMIVGFTVADGSESILLRAAGPGLFKAYPFWFSADSVMADPRLAYYPPGASSATLTNDNWDATLSATIASVGAFPFDVGSKDAAFVPTLSGANNTVWVQGTGGGYVLVEGYGLGNSGSPRLTNISARNHVGTGSDILIAGFVLKGSGTKKLLIRGIGPRLNELWGLTGVLADPMLEIHDTSDNTIATNNDWDASLAPTFDTVGAYQFTKGSKDAAIIVNLAASAAGTGYTAQVKGADGGTGEAVVEVYEVP